MAEIVTKARDTMAKLKNPRTKFQVVNKLDTEEINRLKARYAYIKRKEYLFELLTNYDNHSQHDNDEHRSDWSSSPCSELNFSGQNDVRPSTPVSQEEELNSLSEPINMGDYENRIRPSSNYWYTIDGRNLAEKIIYYRTYRLQSTSELESTLREFHRPLVDPNTNQGLQKIDTSENKKLQKATKIVSGSKSARPKRSFPPAGTPARPISVPPDFAKNSHQLRAIQQRVQKSSGPRKQSSSTFRNKAFDESKLSEENLASVEDVHLTEERENVHTKDRNAPNKEEVEVESQTHESQNHEEIQSPIKPKSSPQKKVESIARNKDLRPKLQPIEENKLISKLDKRIERDLKALQGINDDNGGDDDEDDLDDGAINEILHGQMNADIDEFLKIR